MKASSPDIARGVRDKWVSRATFWNMIGSFALQPTCFVVATFGPWPLPPFVVCLQLAHLAATATVMRPGPLRTRWARRNQRPDLTDRADRAERLHTVVPATHEAGRYDLGRATKMRAWNVEKALDDLTAARRITSRVTTDGRRVYRRVARTAA